MNTKALNELAALICRAQEQDRTPMGIAVAIDAAGRHMSPEAAAELAALRARVAELERVIADAPAAYALMDRVRAVADGITRQMVPVQALREDDPNHLHHDYRVGRDLPGSGGDR